MPRSTLFSGVEVKDTHGFKYMTSAAEMKLFLEHVRRVWGARASGLSSSL
jgi:hypothetical protein